MWDFLFLLLVKFKILFSGVLEFIDGGRDLICFEGNVESCILWLFS